MLNALTSTSSTSSTSQIWKDRDTDAFVNDLLFACANVYMYVYACVRGSAGFGSIELGRYWSTVMFILQFALYGFPVSLEIDYAQFGGARLCIMNCCIVKQVGLKQIDGFHCFPTHHSTQLQDRLDQHLTIVTRRLQTAWWFHFVTTVLMAIRMLINTTKCNQKQMDKWTKWQWHVNQNYIPLKQLGQFRCYFLLEDLGFQVVVIGIPCLGFWNATAASIQRWLLECHMDGYVTRHIGQSYRKIWILTGYWILDKSLADPYWLSPPCRPVWTWQKACKVTMIFCNLPTA